MLCKNTEAAVRSWIDAWDVLECNEEWAFLSESKFKHVLHFALIKSIFREQNDHYICRHHLVYSLRKEKSFAKGMMDALLTKHYFSDYSKNKIAALCGFGISHYRMMQCEVMQVQKQCNHRCQP